MYGALLVVSERCEAWVGAVSRIPALAGLMPVQGASGALCGGHNGSLA